MNAALAAFVERCAPDFVLARWAAVRDGAERGRLGEELAARHLLARGWRIVGRRVATPCAELDLVCRAGDVLVAVEVKAGIAERAARLRPRDRLRPRALARQRRALRWLAGRLGAPVSASRIDLVEVRLLVGGSPWRVRIEHLSGVEFPTRPDRDG